MHELENKNRTVDIFHLSEQEMRENTPSLLTPEGPRFVLRGAPGAGVGALPVDGAVCTLSPVCSVLFYQAVSWRLL